MSTLELGNVERAFREYYSTNEDFPQEGAHPRAIESASAQQDDASVPRGTGIECIVREEHHLFVTGKNPVLTGKHAQMTGFSRHLTGKFQVQSLWVTSRKCIIIQTDGSTDLHTLDMGLGVCVSFASYIEEDVNRFLINEKEAINLFKGGMRVQGFFDKEHELAAFGLGMYVFGEVMKQWDELMRRILLSDREEDGVIKNRILFLQREESSSPFLASKQGLDEVGKSISYGSERGEQLLPPVRFFSDSRTIQPILKNDDDDVFSTQRDWT